MNRQTGRGKMRLPFDSHVMKTELTPKEIGDAIRAFRAAECPSCNGEKRHRDDPFCPDCLNTLPHDLQLRVVLREEFIDAFWPAMEHLRTNRPAAQKTST